MTYHESGPQPGDNVDPAVIYAIERLTLTDRELAKDAIVKDLEMAIGTVRSLEADMERAATLNGRLAIEERLFAVEAEMFGMTATSILINKGDPNVIKTVASQERDRLLDIMVESAHNPVE